MQNSFLDSDHASHSQIIYLCTQDAQQEGAIWDAGDHEK